MRFAPSVKYTATAAELWIVFFGAAVDAFHAASVFGVDCMIGQ